MEHKVDYSISDPSLTDFVKQSKPSALRSLFDVFVLCWGNIIGSVCLFIVYPSIWTYALAFLMVSSRMNASLTLAHDAWHGSLMPSKKWNDFLGGWLCSYPFGSLYSQVRAGHLAHHKYLGTSADPDRDLHVDADKQTPLQFVGYFLSHMFIGQLLSTLTRQLQFGKNRLAIDSDADGATALGEAQAAKNAKIRVPEFGNIVLAQLAIGLSLWAVSGQWWLYFAIWFLPIVSIGTLCYFLRAFGDHGRLAADPDGPFEGRLITIAQLLLWERVFVAPYEFNFHAEHHLYASVPHQYLPLLHGLLKDKEAYQRQCIVRKNYTGFLLAYWQQIWSRPQVAPLHFTTSLAQLSDAGAAADISGSTQELAG